MTPALRLGLPRAGAVRLHAADGAALHTGHLLVALVWALALLLAVRLVMLLVAPPVGVPPLLPAPPVDTSALGRIDPFYPGSAAVAPESLPVTGLPLRLHGVRADRATGQGTAIIAADGDDQAVFAVGDEVMPGVRLVAVAEEHVVLDRGGVREALWLDQGEGGPVQRFAPDRLEPAPLLDAEPMGAPSAPAPPPPLPIDQPDPEEPDRAALEAMRRAVPPRDQARPSFEQAPGARPTPLPGDVP